CTFKTPRFKQYHNRLQLFLHWYIDGASFIVESDDGWEILFLFEKRIIGGREKYSIVGYCTYYNFFHWPMNKRMRIRYKAAIRYQAARVADADYPTDETVNSFVLRENSQFLILPPFQKKGHGARMYKHLYETFRRDPQILEMTVEDPNDEFQLLRDRADLHQLRSESAFDGLVAPVDVKTVQELKAKFKINRKKTNQAAYLPIFKSDPFGVLATILPNLLPHRFERKLVRPHSFHEDLIV
ncbi:acyl-CoA N-acyltransferase, partial [Blyttiomyces helicus]